MKVNYDQKPSTVEAVGDGSIRFRYAVNTAINPAYDVAGHDADSRTAWQCEEVIVWPPLTSNKVLAAAIADRWPQDREQKLVNDYNSAQLGLLDESSKQQAVQNYTQFLNARTELKQEIEALCTAEGIE